LNATYPIELVRTQQKQVRRSKQPVRENVGYDQSTVTLDTTFAFMKNCFPKQRQFCRALHTAKTLLFILADWANSNWASWITDYVWGNL